MQPTGFILATPAEVQEFYDALNEGYGSLRQPYPKPGAEPTAADIAKFVGGENQGSSLYTKAISSLASLAGSTPFGAPGMGNPLSASREPAASKTIPERDPSLVYPIRFSDLGDMTPAVFKALEVDHPAVFLAKYQEGTRKFLLLMRQIPEEKPEHFALGLDDEGNLRVISLPADFQTLIKVWGAVKKSTGQKTTMRCAEFSSEETYRDFLAKLENGVPLIDLLSNPELAGTSVARTGLLTRTWFDALPDDHPAVFYLGGSEDSLQKFVLFCKEDGNKMAFLVSPNDQGELTIAYIVQTAIAESIRLHLVTGAPNTKKIVLLDADGERLLARKMKEGDVVPRLESSWFRMSTANNNSLFKIFANRLFAVTYHKEGESSYDIGSYTLFEGLAFGSRPRPRTSVANQIAAYKGPGSRMIGKQRIIVCDPVSESANSLLITLVGGKPYLLGIEGEDPNAKAKLLAIKTAKEGSAMTFRHHRVGGHDKFTISMGRRKKISGFLVPLGDEPVIMDGHAIFVVNGRIAVINSDKTGNISNYTFFEIPQGRTQEPQNLAMFFTSDWFDSLPNDHPAVFTIDVEGHTFSNTRFVALTPAAGSPSQDLMLVGRDGAGNLKFNVIDPPWRDQIMELLEDTPHPMPKVLYVEQLDAVNATKAFTDFFDSNLFLEDLAAGFSLAGEKGEVKHHIRAYGEQLVLLKDGDEANPPQVTLFAPYDPQAVTKPMEDDLAWFESVQGPLVVSKKDTSGKPHKFVFMPCLLPEKYAKTSLLVTRLGDQLYVFHSPDSIVLKMLGLVKSLTGKKTGAGFTILASPRDPRVILIHFFSPNGRIYERVLLPLDEKTYPLGESLGKDVAHARHGDFITSHVSPMNELPTILYALPSGNVKVGLPNAPCTVRHGKKNPKVAVREPLPDTPRPSETIRPAIPVAPVQSAVPTPKPAVRILLTHLGNGTKLGAWLNATAGESVPIVRIRINGKGENWRDFCRKETTGTVEISWGGNTATPISYQLRKEGENFLLTSTTGKITLAKNRDHQWYFELHEGTAFYDWYVKSIKAGTPILWKTEPVVPAATKVKPVPAPAVRAANKGMTPPVEPTATPPRQLPPPQKMIVGGSITGGNNSVPDVFSYEVTTQLDPDTGLARITKIQTITPAEIAHTLGWVREGTWQETILLADRKTIVMDHPTLGKLQLTLVKNGTGTIMERQAPTDVAWELKDIAGNLPKLVGSAGKATVDFFLQKSGEKFVINHPLTMAKFKMWLATIGRPLQDLDLQNHEVEMVVDAQGEWRGFNIKHKRRHFALPASRNVLQAMIEATEPGHGKKGLHDANIPYKLFDPETPPELLIGPGDVFLPTAETLAWLKQIFANPTPFAAGEKIEHLLHFETPDGGLGLAIPTSFALRHGNPFKLDAWGVIATTDAGGIVRDENGRPVLDSGRRIALYRPSQPEITWPVGHHIYAHDDGGRWNIYALLPNALGQAKAWQLRLVRHSAVYPYLFALVNTLDEKRAGDTAYSTRARQLLDAHLVAAFRDSFTPTTYFVTHENILFDGAKATGLAWILQNNRREVVILSGIFIDPITGDIILDETIIIKHLNSKTGKEHKSRFTPAITEDEQQFLLIGKDEPAKRFMLNARLGTLLALQPGADASAWDLGQALTGFPMTEIARNGDYDPTSPAKKPHGVTLLLENQDMLPQLDEKNEGFEMPDPSTIKKITSWDELLQFVPDFNLDNPIFIPTEAALFAQSLAGNRDEVLIFVSPAGYILQLPMTLSEAGHYVATPENGDSLYGIAGARLLIPHREPDGRKHYLELAAFFHEKRNGSRTLIVGQIHFGDTRGDQEKHDFYLNRIVSSKTFSAREVFGFYATGWAGSKDEMHRVGDAAYRRRQQAAKALLEQCLGHFRMDRPPDLVNYNMQTDGATAGMMVHYEGRDIILGLNIFAGDGNAFQVSGLEWAIASGVPKLVLRYQFDGDDGSLQEGFFEVYQSSLGDHLFYLKDPKTQKIFNFVISPDGKVWIWKKPEGIQRFFDVATSEGFAMKTIEGKNYKSEAISYASWKKISDNQWELTVSMGRWKTVSPYAHLSHDAGILISAGQKEIANVRILLEKMPDGQIVARAGPIRDLEKGEMNDEELQISFPWGENFAVDFAGNVGTPGGNAHLVFYQTSAGNRITPPYGWLELRAWEDFTKPPAVIAGHYHLTEAYENRRLLPRDAGFLTKRAGVENKTTTAKTRPPRTTRQSSAGSTNLSRGEQVVGSVPTGSRKPERNLLRGSEILLTGGLALEGTLAVESGLAFAPQIVIDNTIHEANLRSPNDGRDKGFEKTEEPAELQAPEDSQSFHRPTPGFRSPIATTPRNFLRLVR